MRTLSSWPSLIRHSSQCWLDAFPRPKMEWVNIDMPCVSWEVKGHHKLPKQPRVRHEKEVKQTDFKSRIHIIPKSPDNIHLILSSNGRSGEKSGAMGSIIYTNPSSANPWFALCSTAQSTTTWSIFTYLETSSRKWWNLETGDWCLSMASEWFESVSSVYYSKSICILPSEPMLPNHSNWLAYQTFNELYAL